MPVSESGREKRPYDSEVRRRAAAGTRQALVEAGLNLLASNPSHPLTVREVASRAGVSPGAFYSHWKGGHPAYLNDLLDVLVVDRVEEIREDGSKVSNGDQTSEEITRDGRSGPLRIPAFRFGSHVPLPPSLVIALRLLLRSLLRRNVVLPGFDDLLPRIPSEALEELSGTLQAVLPRLTYQLRTISCDRVWKGIN